MSNLFETIQKLCKDRNITIAALERECGLGNATIKKWGVSIPSGDRLSKVADYFGVSVDYLLGREKEKSEIEKLCFSIAKEAQENGIDPDDIRDMIQIIKKARERK